MGDIYKSWEKYKVKKLIDGKFPAKSINLSEINLDIIDDVFSAYDGTAEVVISKADNALYILTDADASPQEWKQISFA